MMNWLYSRVAHWLTAPLWLWLLVPPMLVMLAAVVIGGIWMQAQQRQLLQLEQQVRDSEQVIRQWREKITALPALHVLQRWLAEHPSQAEDRSVNRLASLLDAPLRDSGVQLESWHPLPSEGANDGSPAWLLVFNAQYGATLNFLSRFQALPVVLRIDHITIRKASAGLRTELRLSLPQAPSAKVAQ
ncbi:hypothetical protein [Dickeya zeae]|uniref:hypothetical protein n=1 Tax=Dickeya zeae TaxID=204042 RepID=UPI001CF12A31|nr:hypothetical protein [Dickeya zeae]MCA6987617.1 hypothetical protein [Dickeya zeae]